MTTPRRPLTEISENQTPRKKSTPYERGNIIRTAKLSHSPTKISKILYLLYMTVQNTILKDLLQTNGKSQPRIRAPRFYSDRGECKY